ncbi:MAG: 2-hydroxychromene-2-carboxylate isomerase [Pseudomonadota bacterium]
MPRQIEFFFDLSSPWTCLAFHNIQPMMAEMGVEIVWRPFLVGGIHNQVNAAYPQARARDFGTPKWKQFYQSLLDWSAWSNVTMNFPGPHFPLRSVHAMRLCCCLEEDQPQLLTFMNAAFEAYYSHQANLDDMNVLGQIATDAGLNGDKLTVQAATDEIKIRLRTNTDEAIKRGAFGSPSIFVPFSGGERLYFGNDQLPLVKWALDQ